jgi:hypothetical protein
MSESIYENVGSAADNESKLIYSAHIQSENKKNKK